MRTQKIQFPDEQAICVFPDQPASLAQAITTLLLKDSYPVIVLIGGGIPAEQAQATNAALECLAKSAEEMQALVICGGTDMGVMAEIGQLRTRLAGKFPLIGIAPESQVTWPGGPFSAQFLGWGHKRWNLAQHYTHFILVPGSEFGDESPWIVEAASLLSTAHNSVTILLNGGGISRKDIQLSLEAGRPVIALSGTGRLADELAGTPIPERPALLCVVPAGDAARVHQAIRAALSVPVMVK